MRIVSEHEFAERLRSLLTDPLFGEAGWVTGPGRSGAVASVYASHILGIPPNRLSELSTLELVSYPSKGKVELQAWVIG